MEENNNNFNEIQEPKKKNNTTTIIFSFVFIILLGFIGYLTYTRIIESKVFKQDNTQEKQNENKKEETKKEEKIAIPAVKKDITEKINALFKAYQEKTNTQYITSMHGFNQDLITNYTINDDDKLEIALNYTALNSKTKINIPKEKVTVSLVKDEYDTIMNEYETNYSYAMEEYFQVNVKDVEKTYKELFNSEIKHRNTNITCPSYYYDNANNVYYALSQCGGISPDSANIYIDNTYTNNDTAYAYVYIGILAREDAKLYNGIDKTKVIKELGEVTYDDNFYNSIKITDSNKEQYSKYKMTFKKDNNENYYFDKIEKVN